MALKCTLITVARYAAIATDNCLTVAGTLDTFLIQPKGNVPANDRPLAISLPPVYLVFSITGSVADGLTHQLRFGVRHEDGQWVVPVRDAMQINFTLNSKGRVMRSQGLMEIQGLVLPAAGDYEVVLIVGNEEIGSHPIYVDVAS